MLTPVDKASQSSSGSTSNPDTQIAATASSSNAIIYTVPTGRKFVGYASNAYALDTSPNYFVRLVAGGVEVDHRSSFSAEPLNYRSIPSPQLTLLAGTSVKVGNSGNNSFVFGVESDA